MAGLCCFRCISTGNVGVVERLGKYQTLAQPGLSVILYPFDQLVSQISTRVLQLDVSVETKTHDNVFVTVMVDVQYQVIREKIYDAFYKLTDARSQIKAFVFDVVRSYMAKTELDEAFSAKEELATAIKEQLLEVMGGYGYQILQALVTDLEPDRRVKDAMNDINASKRLREAATNKAEADKIMQVKAAEAEAESKYLSGVGVSRQRQAIVAGLRDSIQDFSSSIPGTTPADVMNLLLMTQYMDTLRDMAGNSKTSTIFLPHAPDSVGSLQAAMRDGFLQGKAGVDGMGPMMR